MTGACQPSRVLVPGDVDELRRIIQHANEVGESLVVTSSKSPHFRGGLASAEPHALVDLSSWKRIDLVDRRNRVCRVEPGVTYDELLEALRPHGMTLPMPIAPRSTKSVVAAVMDREPGTWPNKQWDGSDPVGSTEFLFGSGEHFRTGAAGGPGSIEAQRKAGGAQKFSSGPSHTDFHRVLQGAQGTMGIVTWATLRAELAPSIEDPHLLRADSLDALIPYVYDVQRALLGEHSFILNRQAAAMLMAGADEARFASLCGSLPAFLCLQNIAGFERLPKERLAYQRDDIGAHAARHHLELLRAFDAVSARDLLSRSTCTCGQNDWRHHLQGGCLSVFFLTTLDRAPELAACFVTCAKEHGVAEAEIGLYIQPIVQNHGCHVELMVRYDSGSPSAHANMQRLERGAVGRLLDAGAFFSRPYGTADRIFAKNPANFALIRQVKSIFDPNRVLHRGKWGL
ncbi:MAG: FAD-binding oxidoreductase [Polyangiales bacterium]